MKWNRELRSIIIKELGGLNTTREQLANRLGIGVSTISRWIHKHDLQTFIDKERELKMRESIELGLSLVAQGYEATEVTKEYIKKEIDPDSGNEIDVKFKIKKYKQAPSIKALQILANKYANEFGEKDNTIEFNTNILNVDSNHMTLRDLQELSNPLDAYEADYMELIDNDSNSLESLGYEELSDCNDVDGADDSDGADGADGSPQQDVVDE